MEVGREKKNVSPKNTRQKERRGRDEEENSERGCWKHIIEAIEQLSKTCFTKQG